MSSQKILQCSECKHDTPHIYSSGWWKCITKKCRHKIKLKIENRKDRNTNKAKGDDRGYDASDEAHNKIAKGSHNQIRRNYR
jgi:hypothetical protein